MSKSHTLLLRHITAEVFAPLALMADFHRPHLLPAVCFSWQGQSSLPCFRELFNYKSSTLLLSPHPTLPLASCQYVTLPSSVKQAALQVHPSPRSCPGIYYAQGGEAECGALLEKETPSQASVPTDDSDV